MILTPDEQSAQQATVAGVDDKKAQQVITDEPPSYEAANAGAAASDSQLQSPTDATPTPLSPISQQDIIKVPKSNFVHVDSAYRSIAGNWNIDLSLPAPERQPTSPISTGTFRTHQGPRPNMYLSTETRPIDARIHVSNSGFAAGSTASNKALIIIKNQFSDISVDLKSRQNETKMHVCVSSNTGKITICLPKDFHGLIRTRADGLAHNSTALRFTPKVKEALTIISAEKTESCVFVGYKDAVESAAQISLDSWTGDEIEVISKAGRIKICYTLLEGEEEETEGELVTLVRHLQESGPVVAFAKFAIRGVSRAYSTKKPKDKGGSSSGQ